MFPRICALLVLTTTLAFAKDTISPQQWPESNPIFQFSIGKLQHTGNYGSQESWNVEVSVLNLSPKKISEAAFHLYLFDKKQIRVGEGYIEISNISPQETIRLNLTASTTGCACHHQLRSAAIISAKCLLLRLQNRLG